MSEVHYLGGVGKMKQHVPGVLVFNKPMDQYTEGEMDLLLARQRLEIEKQNSAAVAGPFNFQQDNYDAALQVVNTALNNIHNPDAIHGIGEILIGKAKKKGGKTGAGKFLQKVAKGVKKGVKAVSKVVTAPLRLIAKGAMEIYLPKAAPAFLYLFAEEKALPDKMKAKRKKADKFKNFVVKKLGMKEKHFMAIIRNKLTKNYGKSPESFLAEAIKNIAVKVAGIGAGGKAKPHVNKQKKKPAGKKPGAKKPPLATSNYDNGGQFDPFAGQGESILRAVKNKQQEQAAADKSESRQAAIETGKDVVNNLTSGNFVGAIMAAIKWLISKLGGAKEGVDFGPDDIPDLAGDSGNAFEYKDLKENYNNLSNQQRDQVKEVATDLIEYDVDSNNARRQIKSKLPYLNDKQVEEITSEVEEGFEALDETEAKRIAKVVKMGTGNTDDLKMIEAAGGGTGTGACSC